MDNIEILLNEYNETVKNIYDKHINDIKSEDDLFGRKSSESGFIRTLNSELDKWADTPLEQLKGVSPREFIEGINDFEYLLEVFRQAAIVADTSVPDFITDKLYTFGSQAIEALLDIVKDKELRADDDEVVVVQQAVSTLGSWKAQNVSDFLIDLLKELGEEEELIAEETAQALSQMGTETMVKLVRRLDNSPEVGLYEERLIASIVYVENELKCDELFACLKNTFRKMKDKALGAMYLADYGDGRAIPVLRGYIEKNKGSLDRETYYSIKSAIEKLGGKCDDI